METRVQTSNTRSIPDTAKNGISLPYLRVDTVDYNLTTMGRVDLIELAALIEADIANIDMQRDSGHTGSWAKPEWDAKAAYARKMKTVQVSLIQAELTRRKESVPSVAKMFMDIAYRLLSGELFEDILGQAKKQHALALGAA